MTSELGFIPELCFYFQKERTLCRRKATATCVKHTNVTLSPLTKEDREPFIFAAVEFFCLSHTDPHTPPEKQAEGPDEMLRFEKRMK